MLSRVAIQATTVAVCVLFFAGAFSGVTIAAGPTTTASTEAIGASPAESGQTPYDHSPENVSELRNTSANGYNISLLRQAFSLDGGEDDLTIHTTNNTTGSYRTYINDTETGEVLYNLSTNQTMGQGVVGLVNDISYDSPPGGYEDWNDAELTNISRTDESSSTYPSGADLTDESWVRDAHVTRFRQSPSTIVQYNQSHTVMYSGEEGNVSALVDYRVIQPTDDTDGSDGVRVYRDLQDHSIQDVCLLTIDPESAASYGDGNPCQESYSFVIGSADNVTHPRIEYEDLENVGETTTYYLAAPIQLDVEVTTEVEEEYQDCEVVGGDEECTTETRWVQDDVSTETTTVLVTDSWDTRVYDSSDIVISQTPNGADFEDDRTELYVYTDGQPIAGVNVSGTEVASPWRFYTHRGTEWDTLETSSDGGSTNSEYLSAVPIRTYAYPSRDSFTTTDSTDGNVYIENTTYGDEREAPSLADNLTFQVANNGDSGNYSHVQSLTLSVGNFNLNDTQLMGMVNGSDLNSTETYIRNTTRVESNLTVTPLNANDTHVRLHINLTTEDGEPIYLGGDVNDGVVSLPNNTTVETNESGEAVVVLRASEWGTASFEPEPWYGKDVAYTPAFETYSASDEVSSSLLYRWFWEAIFIFFIFFWPFWFLDNFPAINTWPPWKA